MKSPLYRIAAFDGGGIRGIYTATLLARLDKEEPGFLKNVKLFAGTSTGSILAVSLAAGRSPAELAELYRKQGGEAFEDSRLDNVRDMGRLIGADFSEQVLKKILIRLFGSATLGDLPRKVVIPAFDLGGTPGRGDGCWKPKFFHNFSGPDSDAGEKIVDVIMRSCAAPSYFPTYQGFIDGGVAANNPSMAALTQALDRRSKTRPPAMEHIRLLSFGTGLNRQFIRGQRLDWGYAQWARPIIRLMMDGMMGVADYQCRQLLGDRYHRLAPALPKPVPMDAVRQTAALVRYAGQASLTDTLAWLRKYF